MASLHSNLNPEAVFKRGFVTKEESESVELSCFGSKLNLVDSEGDSEGIWGAFITEEDRKKYNDNSSSGEEVRCILLNHAVCFFPQPSWGRVLTGKTKGSSRPIFKAADQIERLKETHGAYLKEYLLPKEEADAGKESQASNEAKQAT